jgi:hypothetical protein
MLKRFLSGAGAVFALVFAWKIALLVFSMQPVPANDSFPLDGPVINYLLHGKYANPALAPAMPISGTEVFCAYPPGYQAVLLGWMSLFGTSAVSAMTFHLVLFGLYMLTLLGIFHSLRVPVWPARIAGTFLFAITFHDRPDSLAHVYGMAAVYAFVRSRRSFASESAQPPSAAWTWVAVLFAVLSFSTGLQIGTTYSLLIWIGMLAASFLGRERFPIVPMAALLSSQVGLILLVRFGFPHLWEGFMEHARQTPAFTGLRAPRVADVLKVIRTVPGILAAAALLPFMVRQSRSGGRDVGGSWLLALAATTTGLVVTIASVFFLTPNAVMFAGYLQPLVVGVCLAVAVTVVSRSGRRLLAAVFLSLALLGSVRAVGMTTWGLVCARDFGYRDAMRRVRTELDACGSGKTAVLSSAYLYEACQRKDLNWIHSDWMRECHPNQPIDDWPGLVRLKPSRLVLTQFDYYRRFLALVDQLKAHPELAEFSVVNTARVPAPDSKRALQKVIQHISWAPVIVSISWKEPPR